MDKNKESQTWRKRQSHVAITKQETLLMLRAYQVHPAAWGEIISDMQENTSVMSESTRQLYATSTIKQLKYRLSTKLSKLLAQKGLIEDLEIRLEVENIKRLETRNVNVMSSTLEDSGATLNPRQGPSQQTATKSPDMRDRIASRMQKNTIASSGSTVKARPGT